MVRFLLAKYSLCAVKYSALLRKIHNTIKKRKARETVDFSGLLARQKGIEPPASPLGGVRSILLSYWRIFAIFSFSVCSVGRSILSLGCERSILLSYGGRLPDHYSRKRPLLSTAAASPEASSGIFCRKSWHHLHIGSCNENTIVIQ